MGVGLFTMSYYRMGVALFTSEDLQVFASSSLLASFSFAPASSTLQSARRFLNGSRSDCPSSNSPKGPCVAPLALAAQAVATASEWLRFLALTVSAFLSRQKNNLVLFGVVVSAFLTPFCFLSPNAGDRRERRTTLRTSVGSIGCTRSGPTPPRRELS